MNKFKMKCRLPMAGVLAFVVFTLPTCVAQAQEQIKSRMFELTYASATDVAENFNRTWRGRGLLTTNGCVVAGDMAVPFIEANSVMVTAPESVLDNCAEMIAKIDRKPRQVCDVPRPPRPGGTCEGHKLPICGIVQFVELKDGQAYDFTMRGGGFSKEIER